MKQYYVKIDGKETKITYSYNELKEMGILDFDDIFVREKNEKSWHSAKHYIFSDKPSGYAIDDLGQIVNKNEKCSNYIIDEFGQIVYLQDSVTSPYTSQTSGSTKSATSKKTSNKNISNKKKSSSPFIILISLLIGAIPLVLAVIIGNAISSGLLRFALFVGGFWLSFHLFFKVGIWLEDTLK